MSQEESPTDAPQSTDAESSSNITKTTNGVTYEDISLEVYPDRNQTKKRSWFESWAYNFANVRCKAKVAASLEQSPLVKLLLSALKAKGW